MKPKYVLARALLAAVLAVSINGAVAADEKASVRILNFPAVSVGKIDVIRIDDDPARDQVISKAIAKGKVVIPAGCAINLCLNYAGTQNTDFLLSLPPEAVRMISCSELEMSEQSISNIGHLKKLVALDVENTELTDVGAQQMSGMKDLRHLNLGATLITARGLSYTAGMNKLLWLRLSRNNKLGDDIGATVGRLTTLKNLDLCGTNLNNDTLVHLVPLSKLEELNIRRNNISDKGFVYIAKLKNLTRLDATDTLVTAKGLKLLSSLPRLNNVKIRTRNFKPADLASLHKLLPRVTFENGSREYEFPKNVWEPLH